MNSHHSSDPSSWDPEEASPHATLFGLPPTKDQARIQILPVPWEASCSYGRGTAHAPDAIRRASHQLDLLDPFFGETWRQGIHLHAIDPEMLAWSIEAQHIANRLQDREPEDADRDSDIQQVNLLSEKRSHRVQAWAESTLEQGQIAAVLGGDHSSPLGAIRAAAAGGELSILHLDAHLDQRIAYEGYTQSHASIFYNVLEHCPQVTRLLSLGIRDYSAGEWDRIKAVPERVCAIPLTHWQEQLFAGKPYRELCEEALFFLGERVWISFDIDVLSPDLCPRTGTPVPAGLSFEEASHILHLVSSSGRRIVGFDLCEVWGASAERLDACSAAELSRLEWDANVGARMLYKLCGCAGRAADRA